MDFDFTSLIDRRGRDALAVDLLGQGWAPGAPKEGFDPIPMWVADMSFPTCPAIVEAIQARAAHPLYGYFAPPQGYYDAILSWQRRRHGVEDLAPEHIGYANGVLGGLVSILKALAAPGEPVLVHSPTYIGFTHALEDNGYRIVLSPLQQDGDHVWRMDFADMETKIKAENIHAAILCSPHNPTGRVWEREELTQFLALCRKYDVAVISDEIWSDLVRPGLRHIPTQSVNSDARTRAAALYAPSKTFNLAGLVGSYTVIYDDRLRHRAQRIADATHYNGMNVLSTHALMGAYSDEGARWCDALNQVLDANIDLACSYITGHFPGVEVTKPQGTYMLFPDCAGWLAAHGKSLDDLLRACWDVGVALQDGRGFHGATHLRINLASPSSRIQEALTRLDRYVF